MARKTSSSTSKKRSAPAKPAPAPAVAEAAEKPVAVADAAPAVAVKTAPDPHDGEVHELAPGELLRKPELIDRVVERSGAKKKDVKPILEAALAVLGEAIASGQELNLPPMGKMKVTRKKDAPNAEVLVCRLRRPFQMPGTEPQDAMILDE